MPAWLDLRLFSRVSLYLPLRQASRLTSAPESLETFNQVMSVNTTGLFLCYQLAGRKMIELGSKDGRIIGASSIGGKLREFAMLRVHLK